MTHDLNEADTRAELIDRAIREAGWGVVEGSRVRREVITLGRLQGARQRRSKQDIADYVLVYRGQKLAVIEAKKRTAPDTEGVGQAKRYADKLEARFAYSTNGAGIYQIDMLTGVEEYVSQYPTPDELWDATYAESNAWRDRFSAIPFEDKGGQWQPRYYQHNAINRTLEALTKGNDRILITLATGTGKTAIAFQVAWKLFHSRWNLTDWRSGLDEGEEPKRRPRILFLADRNILADQAYNAFSAFDEDARARISPDEIKKKGRVPKNANVFFTIFQTFMSGNDEDGNERPYFGDYPPDFFDFIVIDECHRGGANDESTWREILDYFSPAVQLGMTATPKRKGNVDTYDYFGEPVYVYSLKEGINDGFLTPFKVRQIATTIDDYTYTPDDSVIEGEVEEAKRYTESDFNKIIVIREREKYRVSLLMKEIDQREKTLVFCATQKHALMVRDLINQTKTSADANYCVRVTADDGEEGERFLRTFQDNEKTIPTILTTSQKLSTGVDARNIRNIVLMRPMNSMIEFKQIIGRGTRLFDDKDYFTIYDFVKAHHHFEDAAWDGEPIDETTDPRPPGPDEPSEPDDPPGPNEPQEPEDDDEKKNVVWITLADGKARRFQHISATSFWSEDGTPMSAADFLNRLFGDLPDLFKDEDELRAIWSQPDTRKSLLDTMGEKGYGTQELTAVRKIVNAEDSDLFDVLAYIAFALDPITREERVVRSESSISSHYDDKQRAFVEFVLRKYISEGITELGINRLPDLVSLKYGSTYDAAQELGSATAIRDVFIGFQQYLYQPKA